jgi:hypothetical protein
MTSPPDAAGIVVGPIVGAPPRAEAALAEAMAQALRQGDIPADTGAANRRSYRLSGTVEAGPGDRGTRVAVEWRLKSAAGKLIGQENAVGEVADAAWLAGDPGFAKALAVQAAPAVAKEIEGDVPVERKPVKPVIAVVSVTGAPGDGNASLSRAMGDALRRAGFDLARNAAAPALFRLTGKVTLGPPRAGKENVTIVWVLSATKGHEIGRVNQANAVPARSLDHAWGDTAYDVALAAVGGVVELIQRARMAAGS